MKTTTTISTTILYFKISIINNHLIMITYSLAINSSIYRVIVAKGVKSQSEDTKQIVSTSFV